MRHAKDSPQFNFEQAFFASDLPGMESALDSGATVDSQIGGLSALAMCARYGWKERGSFLLGRGADPWTDLRHGSSSPMREALANEDREFAAMLGASAPGAIDMAAAGAMVGRAALVSREAGSIALECLGPLDRQEVLDGAVMSLWVGADDGQREAAALLALGADPWMPAWKADDSDGDDDFSLFDRDPSKEREKHRELPLAVALAAADVDFTGRAEAGEILIDACEKGSPDHLQAVVARGCRPSLLPEAAVEGFEALCSKDMEYADDGEREDQARCGRILLACGLAPDGLDGEPSPTPLMLALKAGCAELGMVLLAAGADPLAKRGREGVAALAKPYMGGSEFALAYGAAVEAKEIAAAAPSMAAAPARSPKPSL